MVKLTATLFFILSVATATGSLLMASRLRENHRLPVFSTLLYYEAFYFAFGFYAIWGQVIIRALLASFADSTVLDKTANMMTLLGMPFVIFTWTMLLKMAREISGRGFSNSASLWFLVANMLVPVAVGIFWSQDPSIDQLQVMKYYYMAFSLAYTLAASFFMFRPLREKALLQSGNLTRLAGGLVTVTILQIGILYFYSGNVYVALAFALFYYLGGALMPLYLHYTPGLPRTFRPQLASAPGDASLDAFLDRLEITPREKEIVREICNGLSNQQIADKLFISLQTVKDHTSRIYYKTNCSSRAMLIKMIGDVHRTAGGG